MELPNSGIPVSTNTIGTLEAMTALAVHHII